MDWIIRRAVREDEAEIVRHNAAMALETEKRQLCLQTLQAGVCALLCDPAKGFYLVAECAGACVGQLMVTHEWSDWRNGTFWWIQSVYVRPEWRKRGVYRSLYAHLMAEARQRPDIVGLRLYVARENHPAKKVYRSLGMHEGVYDLFEVDFVLE